MANEKIKSTNKIKEIRPNLVDQVSTELRQLVVSGKLSVGDKLPSELALTKQYSVSRTVVREALAALRSDGLVESRQGAGVFVIENKETDPSSLAVVNFERISSVVEMLELRVGIEAEAAGLAALRRSPAQEDKLFQILENFITNVKNEESTTELDREFHLEIANATNNPRFAEMLKLMGASVIPRSSLKEGIQEFSSVRTPIKYLEQIHAEHLLIAEAISQRDEAAARKAMRNHLMGSQDRYRTLLRKK